MVVNVLYLTVCVCVCVCVCVVFTYCSLLYRFPHCLCSFFEFLPPSLCCSLEVVLRAEAVEMVQAGDKCDFTGTLIVVPDVSQLRTEGQQLIKVIICIGLSHV